MNIDELKLDNITRLEVIGKSGRLIVLDSRTGSKIDGVELSIQDEGKTLKIFINEDEE